MSTALFYDLLFAAQQVGLGVERAYADVLRYGDLVEFASSNFNAHQEVHDRLRQMVAVNLGRRADLEQAALIPDHLRNRPSLSGDPQSLLAQPRNQ